MITRVEFGQRMSIIRAHQGKTQAELGAPAKLNKGVICKVENGQRSLDYLDVARLGEHWGFCIKALYRTKWDPTKCLQPTDKPMDEEE